MTVSVALIGFGEAGRTFATAACWGDKARAFDIDPARQKVMADAHVVPCASARGALNNAPIALSLVTADAALNAVRACAPKLDQGAIWIDMNSVAPDTKRAASEAVEQNGARYVDAAILAPVQPAKMSVPILLAGKAAEEAAARLSELGFSNLRVVGLEVGRASAIKMIRSVMVKGIEALTDEMMAAATAAGVADEVIASLDAAERHDSWATRALYNLERMAAHGMRRAAEMEEAGKTLRSFGVDPVMTSGTIQRQRAAAIPGMSERGAA